jgi:pantoate--beta-alanine ligase
MKVYIAANDRDENHPGVPRRAIQAGGSGAGSHHGGAARGACVADGYRAQERQIRGRQHFHKYPRPIEEDLGRCEAAGVDLVFNPPVEELYPTQPYTDAPIDIGIDIPMLSNVLEGRFRPNHFRGVCQVVAKLFNILQPTAACFGEKDYQQLRILTAMAEALDYPIQVIPCPTLRDADGLAMSSRNKYLTASERQRALSISRSLFSAREEFEKGVRQTNRLVTTIQKTLLDVGSQGRVPLLIDYVAAVDAGTLKNVDVVERPTVLAVAARVGNTRLIDNVILNP